MGQSNFAKHFDDTIIRFVAFHIYNVHAVAIVGNTDAYWISDNEEWTC